MRTSKFTVDHAATVRVVRPYVSETRGDDPVPLADLESAESLAQAVGRIIVQANELLPALRALKLGTDRIEHEIDYLDPKHLISLLEDQGCTILDRQAVARLVAEEPGPLYYGDIDLCEDGADWALSGGPWADRLEGKLVELGAVRREDEQPA